MIIKEIGPFRQIRNACPGGSWRVGRKYSFDLCSSILTDWFDVDEGELLWVQIHDHPAKNRLKVVGRNKQWLFAIDRHGNKEHILMHEGWSRLRISYPCYVEIVQ